MSRQVHLAAENPCLRHGVIQPAGLQNVNEHCSPSASDEKLMSLRLSLENNEEPPTAIILRDSTSVPLRISEIHVAQLRMAGTLDRSLNYHEHTGFSDFEVQPDPTHQEQSCDDS